MPNEVHSHRWLVNYMPEKLFERIKPDRHRQWGLWPWEIRSAFSGYRDLLRENKGAALLRAKREAGWPPAKLDLLWVLNIIGTACWALQQARSFPVSVSCCRRTEQEQE